jgi:hypothetical protein
VEGFSSDSSSEKMEQEQEHSDAAMAELATDQHVRYIVPIEKVTHSSTSPSAPVSSTFPAFWHQIDQSEKNITT